MPQRVLISFGSFVLDATARELRKNGEFIPLTPKVLELLLLLASRDGGVVEKQEIIEAIWPDTVVEEGNLTQTVFVLRKMIEDAPGDPAYILTVPRRGYRLAGIRQEATVADTVTVDAAPTAVKPEGINRSRWAIAAACVLAAVALGLIVQAQWSSPAMTALDQPRRVVVLPFVNMSANPGTEYLSDGLTEEIINALAPIPGLKVVARTSAFQFKGKNVDIRSIGRTLDVDAVLEGSIRTGGNRLRITAQLNNTRDGYHYWSRTWERSTDDVFAVQQEIAHEVANALGGQNRVPVPRIKPFTRSWEAHNVYLQGRDLKGRNMEGTLPRVVASFERALAIDPAFAAAHAQIGQAYIWAAHHGNVSWTEALPEVKRRAQLALALDPDLSLAHALLADVNFFGDWDFASAERSFRRAIELDPSDTGTHHEFAHFLIAMGKFDEAGAEARLNAELDPVSQDTLTHMQYHFLMAGDIPRALSAAERTLAVVPPTTMNITFLQWTHEQAGQFGKAIEALARRPGVKPEVVASFKSGYEREGEAGYWKAWHAWQLGRSQDAASRAWVTAVFHARMGQKEQALRLLKQAVDLHFHGVVYLAVSTEFTGLRQDPEFQSLVRRIGLPVL